MIDLHNHILCGLDDGPETMEESIAMCRIAYADGIRSIVATPHTLNGVYRNNRTDILARVVELTERVSESSLCRPDDQLNTLPGADIHLDTEIPGLLMQDTLMTLGDGKRFLLIEFPSQGIPFGAEQILFQLMAMRVYPIITHPERNLEIMRKPGRYSDMIRGGCLGQVTAMSLLGGFGPETRRFSEELVARRLVHFIATDAHSTNGRAPVLSGAVRAASKIVGREEADRMVRDYPAAILEGRRPELAKPLPF